MCAGLFCGCLISRRLWLSSRLYPLSPVLGFPALSSPWDGWFFWAALAVLALIPLARNPRPWIALFLAVAIVAALQDQSRWQPWFYQYLFMLAALGLSHERNPEAGLNTCRLILASAYIWSGLSKLNPRFLETVVPRLLEPLTKQSPGKLAYATAVAESMIGVALLFPRSRRVAVWCGVAMHLGILASIGPLGSRFNPVIWPWNVAMIAFLWLLFGRSENTAREILWSKSFVFQKAVLILFGLAPALGFFGLWDSYLSFSLYSGNLDSASIYLSDASYDRLPGDFGDWVYEEAPNLNRLSIRDWSLGELNVPAYPEPRIFRNLARHLCTETGSPADLRLVIEHKLTLLGGGGESVETCAGLAKYNRP